MATLVEEHGTERDKQAFEKIGYGLQLMHDHAHPTLEGTLQVWGEGEGQRIFGPTYSRQHCVRGLKWGLFANLKLLEEIEHLKPQGAERAHELAEFGGKFERWLHEHQIPE